jgi:hypothetical protein
MVDALINLCTQQITFKMKIAIPILLLVMTITGCKKNEFVLDYSGIDPIIIVPNSNWPGKGLYDPMPVDSAYGVETLTLYARVSYADPLDHPVKVTFKVAPELLADYNTKWGTSYQLLPSDAYEVSLLQVTIPAGVQQATIPITLFPQKINGTQDYFIAFTLDSADSENIAANAKSIIFTLKGQ